MGDELIGWVDEQLEATGLDDEAGLVVLAALVGDDELDGFLGGDSRPVRPSREGDAPAEVVAGGTYLSSIEVEGFRGIGSAVRLPLTPRPGLTIVAGRNGSGKSSLSEALELVLTGSTYRWREKKAAMWKGQWRNIHHPSTSIRISAVEEGAGDVAVRAAWSDDATEVDAHMVTAQRPGEKQTHGVASLGWSGPLTQYRPILSYDELGKVLDAAPSQLYDSLAGILGVEQLQDALARIQSRLKARKAPQTAVNTTRRALLDEARQLDDDRAGRAVALLKKASPDTGVLDALEALATGGDVPQGPVAVLRALTTLTVHVDVEEARRRAAAVRSARDGVVVAADDNRARTRARLAFLESALVLHTQHGDMECPVCRRGHLDADWHDDRATYVREQRQQFEELDHAQQVLEAAIRGARQAVSPAPRQLDQAPLPELAEPVARARAAWDAWARTPELAGGAVEPLAVHLETRLEPLLEALAALREACEAEVARLDDVWRPVAGRVAAWVVECRSWLKVKPTVEVLDRAEKWLKTHDLRLKNERLAPIEASARSMWAKLRQESNVDIGALTLAGSKTSRHVKIESAVDGTDATLAVLSQGELHALALALFLPRATLDASPFRFLVLDDPVQAMDPAKVDGLVEVLAEIAQTRQVVVFSHDDRLPAAVRRSPVEATILEVARGLQSQVTIGTSVDPAKRYLDDAFGLVREHEEGKVGDDALRRVLPGLVRFAVESAAKDVVLARGVRAGTPLVDVEATWNDAHTTRKRLMLAGLGSAQPPEHEAAGWFAPPYRKLTLKVTNAGLHTGMDATVEPRDCLHDAKRVVADLQSLLP